MTNKKHVLISYSSVAEFKGMQNIRDFQKRKINSMSHKYYQQFCLATYVFSIYNSLRLSDFIRRIFGNIVN